MQSFSFTEILLIGIAVIILLLLVVILVKQRRDSDGSVQRNSSRNKIAVGISLGLAFGAAFGIGFGTIINNISIGIAIGPGIGMATGAAIGAALRDPKKLVAGNPAAGGKSINLKLKMKLLLIGFILAFSTAILLIITVLHKNNV